jgi:hypothetical protein
VLAILRHHCLLLDIRTEQEAKIFPDRDLHCLHCGCFSHTPLKRGRCVLGSLRKDSSRFSWGERLQDHPELRESSLICKHQLLVSFKITLPGPLLLNSLSCWVFEISLFLFGWKTLSI